MGINWSSMYSSFPIIYEDRLESSKLRLEVLNLFELIIIVIILLIWELFADGFPLESPQVSRTLLSILADLSNDVLYLSTYF